jgi:mono/diheme cytochrome c family protein
MRVRIEKKPFGGRRGWPAILVAAILGGGGTAFGVTARAGFRQTESPAPTPDVKNEDATRSVWDGVYTEEQAARGRSLFRTQCADCHQPEEFKGGYRTANDLFSSREGMPQSSPNSLTAEEYAELIAYIFEANGLPSGKEELKGDPEILKRIRIEAEKPAGR